MQLTNPITSRNQWYDRNPSPMISDYNGVVSPHVATERWSYTVPVGKKAYGDAIMITVIRTAAASNASNPNIVVYYTPSGGSKTPLFRVELLTNTGGERDSLYFGQFGIMSAGDEISCETEDGSTGGEVGYHTSLKLTEFDG